MFRPLLALSVAACSAEPRSPGTPSTGSTPADPVGAVREVSFFQAVEVPVVVDAAAVEVRNAPIVAGREALVRARLELPADWVAAEVELAVDLTVDGAVRTFTATEQVDGSSDEADPESGLAVAVPADALVPGASYVVRASVAGEELARFPASGAAALDPIETGPLKLVLVPFEVDGWTPDTSDAVVQGYRDALLATYPVTDVEVTVGAVQTWTGPADLGEINVQVGVLQEDAMFAGEVGWDVYYFGLVTGPSRDAWEGATGTSEDGGAGELVRAYFAAGAAFADQQSEDTLIHELGHVHGLDHAPCDGESDVDPNFPYLDGTIGVEGYDRRTGTFVPADTKDMMTYCYPRWISDYGFGKIADHVALAQTFAGFE